MQTFFLEIILQNSTKKTSVFTISSQVFSLSESDFSILTIPTFLNGKMRVLEKKKYLNIQACTVKPV